MHVQYQLMMEVHNGRKVGQANLRAFPEIGIETNPFKGMVLECKNHEVTPRKTS